MIFINRESVRRKGESVSYRGSGSHVYNTASIGFFLITQFSKSKGLFLWVLMLERNPIVPMHVGSLTKAHSL